MGKDAVRQFLLQYMSQGSVHPVESEIGGHIRKIKGSIAASLMEFINMVGDGERIPPCQMYLRNSQNGSGECTDSDICSALQIVENRRLRYYTHASLIINLSRPVTKKNPNDETWVMGLLTKDLRVTSAIGGRGVVVHVGKEVGIGRELALNKMESSIRLALVFSSE